MAGRLAAKRRKTPIIYGEDLCGRAQFGEQVPFGSGQPDLCAQGKDLLEQGAAAVRVEMGRHFVQQNQWRRAALGGQQSCVRQDDGQKQRLLLAGRAFGGRTRGLDLCHLQIAAMRPHRRAAGFGAEAGYGAAWNDTGILALQIETRKGLANSAAIAATVGLMMHSMVRPHIASVITGAGE